MYRLPEEDERLKGNLGAIRKGGGVEWILDRNSTTSIIPEAICSQEQRKGGTQVVVMTIPSIISHTKRTPN